MRFYLFLISHVYKFSDKLNNFYLNACLNPVKAKFLFTNLLGNRLCK